MSDLKQNMQRAREFIAENLAECCRDELDWQESSILRDGKLREAAAIFREVDRAHAIPMAQSETARQAMQLARRTQPEATAPAQGFDRDIVLTAMREIREASRHGETTRIYQIADQFLGSSPPTPLAQDLSAAILALPCPGSMSQFASLGDLKLYQEGHKEALEAAAALASSANALSAGDSQKALDALLTRIGDAFEAYERYGAICEFEGNPMIYADTLTEIVTLRGEYHAILQSQKDGHA